VVDVWQEVAGRRSQLADIAVTLDEAALEAPSWCAGWRVRDVLGHLVYVAEATQRGVMRDVIVRGPGPNRAMDRTARSLGRLGVDELAGRLRRASGGRFHVLGSPPAVALGETLVHGADMLRPLGIDDDVDPSAASAVIPAYHRLGRLAFGAAPAASVTLVATDTDLAVGRGPEVRGRAIDLLLLLANRRQVVDQLSGPGVSELAR
jgi:uncharacterized protein (TIGR03083 family)